MCGLDEDENARVFRTEPCMGSGSDVWKMYGTLEMIGEDFSKLGEESASLPFDLGTQVFFKICHLLQFQFSYFFIPFFIFRLKVFFWDFC